MERKVNFVENEYYHLYNRGVEKRTIFSSSNDYRRFLALLYLTNSQKSVHMANTLKVMRYSEVFTLERGSPLVAIGAYCLMPNHFHILATPVVKNGLTKFMLKLQTGYSMYFNIKNDRSGSLFQGPFKSEHATGDAYLKYLFSYIHLNPAKLKDPCWKETFRSTRAPLKKFVEDYPYSSLGAYISNKHLITNPDKFPNYLASRKEIASHLDDWLYIKGSP